MNNRQLADQLYADCRVTGVEDVKAGTSSFDRTCDACPSPIEQGSTYVRVWWTVEQRPELFHLACYRSEFT